MSPRFIVVDRAEAMNYYGWEEWEPYSEWDDPNFLVDTLEGVVIFSDQCEPEDATLHRHFHVLVDILNERIA